MKIKVRLFSVIAFFILGVTLFSGIYPVKAEMPFYDLRPKELVLRAQFYTSYSSSQEERKSNIMLASKALNNTFVDVGGEFSFNKTVGERNAKRGYKEAKIIFNGKFVEGVGGGVCQVSTTLYNAVLLAGLKVTEVHPHSLAVGYVAPSFDAMVNSGSADLKFVNNTYNPIIIKTFADGNKLKIQIYGEEMDYKIERKSVTICTISAPAEDIVDDDKGEYPNLLEGERMVVSYSKEGLISEGYIVKKYNGREETTKIRRDKYSPLKGLIVIGKTKKEGPSETDGP